MANPAYHWQLMGEMNPEMLANCRAWMGEINKGETIPLKYQELISVGMAYVLRSEPAILTHTANAVEKYGATKQEIFTVLALAMMLGGVPAYRESCLALEEYLSKL